MDESAPATGRQRGRAALPAGALPARPVLAAVLPVAAVTLLGAGLAAFLAAGHPSPAAAGTALAVTAVAALAVLGAAARSAVSASRLHQRLAALRAASASGEEELRALAEALRRGERPAAPEPGPAPAGADLLGLLAHDLRRERHAARLMLAQASPHLPGARPDHRVEVLVNLSRRMQALVYREIQLLDRLEAQVEDPELLKGLFGVDALATRMRRQTESLAVLGGAVARRQWSRPVPLHEVLRAAIAEVEHYDRVKVVPPVHGTVEPAAVADLIHLLAELIENAVKFSPPEVRTLLRAGEATAGLVIEVEDRGLGIPPHQRRELNRLLAGPGPGPAGIGELLSDGRIGLIVVSALARRQGISVELQGNIFGGTQAVAVLPRGAARAAPRAEEAAPRAGELPPLAAQPGPVLPPPAVPAGIAAPGTVAAAPGPARPRRDAAGPAAGGPGIGPAPAAGPAGPAGQHRPPLPTRGRESHMAPQLRAGRAAMQGDPGGHSPGLMAAFRGGVRRAEEDDGPGGGSGHPTPEEDRP